MSYGKNVASVLTERVPCTFAKAKNGAQGTHAVTVMFNHLGQLVWVGCECQDLHGDGVQAIYEMEGGKNACCFSWVAAFTNAVRLLSKNPTTQLFPNAITPPDVVPARNLRFVFSRLASEIVSVHNTRVANTSSINPSQDFKTAAIQKVVNNVVGSVLGLEPITVLGKHYKRVEHHEKKYRKFDQVFGTHHSWLYAGDGREVSGDYIILATHRNQTDSGLAARSRTGEWILDEDSIKSWASSNHQTAFYCDAVSKRNPGKETGKTCIFCKETFERMKKHTEGAKHIARVLEVVKIACKATSPVGLRMLNNPKHRSAFIRRR